MRAGRSAAAAAAPLFSSSSPRKKSTELARWRKVAGALALNNCEERDANAIVAYALWEKVSKPVVRDGEPVDGDTLLGLDGRIHHGRWFLLANS